MSSVVTVGGTTISSVSYSYDALGDETSDSEGARVTLLTYDAKGNVLTEKVYAAADTGFAVTAPVTSGFGGSCPNNDPS